MPEDGFIIDYLNQIDLPYEEIGDLVWRVENKEDNVDNLIVAYSPPIVLFRINLMKVPDNDPKEFYRRLLKINVGEIPHGAFGIEDDKVVLVDTLQAENLDFNEFQSSIEALSFAVASFYNELKDYRDN